MEKADKAVRLLLLPPPLLLRLSSLEHERNGAAFCLLCQLQRRGAFFIRGVEIDAVLQELLNHVSAPVLALTV